MQLFQLRLALFWVATLGHVRPEPIPTSLMNINPRDLVQNDRVPNPTLATVERRQASVRGTEHYWYWDHLFEGHDTHCLTWTQAQLLESTKIIPGPERHEHLRDHFVYFFFAYFPVHDFLDNSPAFSFPAVAATQRAMGEQGHKIFLVVFVSRQATHFKPLLRFQAMAHFYDLIPGEDWGNEPPRIGARIHRPWNPSLPKIRDNRDITYEYIAFQDKKTFDRTVLARFTQQLLNSAPKWGNQWNCSTYADALADIVLP